MKVILKWKKGQGATEYLLLISAVLVLVIVGASITLTVYKNLQAKVLEEGRKAVEIPGLDYNKILREEPPEEPGEAVCGNGVVEEGEECDGDPGQCEPNQLGQDAIECRDCVCVYPEPPEEVGLCGDYIWDPEREECDVNWDASNSQELLVEQCGENAVDCDNQPPALTCQCIYPEDRKEVDLQTTCEFIPEKVILGENFRAEITTENLTYPPEVNASLQVIIKDEEREKIYDFFTYLINLKEKNTHIIPSTAFEEKISPGIYTLTADSNVSGFYVDRDLTNNRAICNIEVKEPGDLTCEEDCDEEKCEETISGSEYDAEGTWPDCCYCPEGTVLKQDPLTEELSCVEIGEYDIPGQCDVIIDETPYSNGKEVLRNLGKNLRGEVTCIWCKSRSQYYGWYLAPKCPTETITPLVPRCAPAESCANILDPYNGWVRNEWFGINLDKSPSEAAKLCTVPGKLMGDGQVCSCICKECKDYEQITCQYFPSTVQSDGESPRKGTEITVECVPLNPTNQCQAIAEVEIKD